MTVNAAGRDSCVSLNSQCSHYNGVIDGLVEKAAAASVSALGERLNNDLRQT